MVLAFDDKHTSKLCLGSATGYESTVCFAFSEAQVCKIIDLGIGKSDGTLVVPSRLDLCLQLDDAGVNFRPLWSFVRDDDRIKIHKECEGILESWYKPFENEATYHDYIIPEIDKHSLQFFFEDCDYLNLAFERLIANIHVRRCVLVSSFDQPMEFHPKKTEIHPSVVAYFCYQKGIPLQIIPLKAPGPFHFSNRLPKIARAWGEYVDLKIEPNHHKKHNREDNCPIVGILIDVINEYQAYIDMLSSSGFKILAFSLWQPSHDALQKLKQSSMVIPLGIPLDNAIGSPYESLFAKAFEMFKSASVELYLKKGHIFRDRWLDFQFRHIFLRRWPHLCRFIDETRNRVSDLDLDVLLTAAYSVPESVILASEVKPKGVPLIAVAHSSNLELTSPWTEAERIGVLMDFYIPENFCGSAEFVTIGSVKHFIDFKNQGLRKTKESMRLELGLPPEKKIIFAVTTCYSEALLPLVDHDKTISWMQRIASVPERIRNRVLVVWKSKPNADDSKIYEYLVKEVQNADANMILSSQIALDNLASACDIAVGISYWTTGFVDIVLNGIPLIYCVNSDAVGFFEEGNGKIGIPWDSVLKVEREDLLWEVIERALFDDQYRESLVAKQQQALRDSMPIEDVPGRLKNMVIDVLRN